MSTEDRVRSRRARGEGKPDAEIRNKSENRNTNACASGFRASSTMRPTRQRPNHVSNMDGASRLTIEDWLDGATTMAHDTFRAGDLTAIIGDNAAAGEHRAGYNGVWSLTHRTEPANVFVPA